MRIFRGTRKRAWVALTAMLLLQGASVIWTSRAGWVGWMPAGGATLERTSLFGACILSAAVAWAAVSLRAHNAEPWARVGVRSVQGLYRGPFWWGLSASLVTNCVLATTVGVATRQSLTSLMLTRYLLSVAAVVAASACAAALGVLIAKFTPPFIAVVASFVLPYAIAIGLGAYLSESPVSAWAVPDLHAFDYAWPAIETPIFRAASLGSIAAAIVFELHRRTTLRKVALWAASAATAGLFFTAGMVQPIPEASSVECQGAVPVVCFDGTQDAIRAGYLAQLDDGLRELPRSTWPAVVTATEQQGAPEDAVALPPVEGKYRPSRTTPPGAVTAILGDVTFNTDCASPDRIQLSAAMTLWWRAHVGLPTGGGTYAGQNSFTGPEFAQARASISRLEARIAQHPDQVIADAATQLHDCSRPAQPPP